MTNTWVLVADASRAQFYRQAASGELEVFMELSHPESRMKGDQLASDRPGRQQSKGTGHGTFVKPGTLKQHEAENFAKELAETIEKARVRNEISDLIIAAPPHFSGLLTQALPKGARALVRATVEKDYTALAPRELRERVAAHVGHRAE